MYFRPLPYDYSRPETLSSVFGASKYPIGFSVDAFLHLFNDVSRFKVSAYSVPLDNARDLDIRPVSLSEAIDELDPSELDTVSIIEGTTTRIVKPAGVLAANGNELSISARPRICIDYPKHTAGGSGGVFTLDFGNTVNVGNLFFPEISILFSNGMSSNGAGAQLGSVSLNTYGIIPIFGNTSTLAVVGGDIDIEEEYSSLGLLPGLVSRNGGVVQVRSYENGKKFTGFSKIKEVWLNEKLCSLTIAQTGFGTTATVTIPANARSGYLKFIQPNGDVFFSPDPLIVS